LPHYLLRCLLLIVSDSVRELNLTNEILLTCIYGLRNDDDKLRQLFRQVTKLTIIRKWWCDGGIIDNKIIIFSLNKSQK